jgi:hypothetical protein
VAQGGPRHREQQGEEGGWHREDNGTGSSKVSPKGGAGG